MSRIYAAGAAMGWTVAEVKAVSMWEFWSAWHGFVRANSSNQGAKLSEGEADDLFDWIDVRNADGQLTTQTYLWDGREFLAQGEVSL